MSKKQHVKSTQSSAPTTAKTARQDAQRTTWGTQASSAGDTDDTSDTSDTSLRAVPATGSEARDRRIAEAAYYLSEQRGFAPGHEVEDWLAAEQQIDSRIEDGRGVIGPMQIS